MTRIGPFWIKLRFACGPGFAMGPGKADLLEAIERTGSISGAARDMGMSYRRAWLLVSEANRCFRAPLVETLTGGGRERGARLTAEGRHILASFRALEAESARLADTEMARDILASLRDEPLPQPSGDDASPE
jgi:molybdate transport system regulatory protein